MTVVTILQELWNPQMEVKFAKFLSRSIAYADVGNFPQSQPNGRIEPESPRQDKIYGTPSNSF